MSHQNEKTQIKSHPKPSQQIWSKIDKDKSNFCIVYMSFKVKIGITWICLCIYFLIFFPEKYQHINKHVYVQVTGHAY